MDGVGRTEVPKHRGVGGTMLYVGFGSISGLVHLIARIRLAVRPVAIFVIATVLVTPLR